MRSSYDAGMDVPPDPDDIWVPTIDEIDAMRAQRGLTIKELAKRAGIHRKTYSDIINDRQNCQVDTLRSIMSVLREAKIGPRGNLGNGKNE